MASLSCIGLCFKDTFSKPEPYLAIGLIVGIAAAVALTVLGSLQISQSTFFPSNLVVNNLGKTIGYFMGAGAALGLSALALQHLLERQIAGSLDKSLSDKTVEVLRWVQLVFSICAVAAAITLIVLSLHYFSGMLSAYDGSGNFIGCMADAQKVLNACGGVFGSGALGLFGFVACFHALVKIIPNGDKRVIVKEIVSIPVNQYLEDDSRL